MSLFEPGNDRQKRIELEVLGTALQETDQALNWYTYLQNRLRFPFKARWVNYPANAAEDGVVEVLGMASASECVEGIWVRAHSWDGPRDCPLTLPLAELDPLNPDPDTAEAIADWHYWVEMNRQ